MNTTFNKKTNKGLILHLINLTGFSGNTYFEPLPVHHLNFKIRVDFKPLEIVTMVAHQPISYTYKDNYVSFMLNDLDAFSTVLINR